MFHSTLLGNKINSSVVRWKLLHFNSRLYDKHEKQQLQARFGGGLGVLSAYMS